MSEGMPQNKNFIDEKMKQEVNEAFESYLKEQLKGMEAEYRQMKELNLMGTQTVEEALAKAKERYAKFDVYSQITEMTNNFHGFMPGGMYLVWEGEAMDKKREKCKSIIEDLEKIIAEEGYTQQEIELMQKSASSEEEKQKKFTIKWKLFKKMIDLGHDEYKLTV
jgi:hypothetical protein